MCEPSQIAAYLRSALRLGDGRRLFVIESDNGDGGFALEAVIADAESIRPEAALQEFCVASGREVSTRRCLPVIVPDGFDPGSNPNYRLVRKEDRYTIEPR